MKPEDVKIIQIVPMKGFSSETLHGLGDDGHVYRLEYPPLEHCGFDGPETEYKGPYWNKVI